MLVCPLGAVVDVVGRVLGVDEVLDEPQAATPSEATTRAVLSPFPAPANRSMCLMFTGRTPVPLRSRGWWQSATESQLTGTGQTGQHDRD